MDRWLVRLEWEGDDNMFGVLNMYVCRGVKPLLLNQDTSSFVIQSVHKRTAYFGDSSLPGWNPKPKQDHIFIEVTARDAPPALIQELTDLINQAYAISDTGITLSLSRVQLHDVQEMVHRGAAENYARAHKCPRMQIAIL